MRYTKASCKYPPAEPEALRSLAPQRGLFATVESKSKNNSKSTESKARAYSRNCQTSTASPAEPGGLPIGLDIDLRKSDHLISFRKCLRLPGKRGAMPL